VKVWIGAELEADVADSFREARSKVEKTINATLEGKQYDIALNSWDCIAIIRDDKNFPEITKYSPKKREMDFRLKIDYKAFKEGNQLDREKLIFGMLRNSLSIIKANGVFGDGLDNLIADVDFIGKTNNWI
jgi:hypothetical protein